MSRQVGEPMGSYCARRKRWHKRLKGLDDGFAVSEKIQADMLLEQAGISQDQQLMVLTSTGNKYSYEKISEVLNEHHSKLHEKEKRSAHGGGFGDRLKNQQAWKDRRSASGSGSFKPRRKWGRAFNAAVADGYESDSSESEGEAAC